MRPIIHLNVKIGPYGRPFICAPKVPINKSSEFHAERPLSYVGSSISCRKTFILCWVKYFMQKDLYLMLGQVFHAFSDLS